MNKETKLQRNIMVAMSQAGATVFRNETGNFWTGRIIHKDKQTVTLANAQMIPCGLCKGSSDIVGWKPVTITPDMVGKKVAVFIGVEVKTPQGRVSKEQEQFIEHVNKKGGIAGVARSVQDALDLLARK